MNGCLAELTQMCCMLAKLRLTTASSNWLRCCLYISPKMETVSWSTPGGSSSGLIFRAGKVTPPSATPRYWPREDGPRLELTCNIFLIFTHRFYCFELQRFSILATFSIFHCFWYLYGLVWLSCLVCGLHWSLLSNGWSWWGGGVLDTIEMWCGLHSDTIVVVLWVSSSTNSVTNHNNKYLIANNGMLSN